MTSVEQTNIRLQSDIKGWLKRQAKANRRSLSAEITYRLEQSRQQQEKAEEVSGDPGRKARQNPEAR